MRERKIVVENINKIETYEGASVTWKFLAGWTKKMEADEKRVRNLCILAKMGNVEASRELASKFHLRVYTYAEIRDQGKLVISPFKNE